MIHRIIVTIESILLRLIVMYCNHVVFGSEGDKTAPKGRLEGQTGGS